MSSALKPNRVARSPLTPEQMEDAYEYIQELKKTHRNLTLEKALPLLRKRFPDFDFSDDVAAPTPVGDASVQVPELPTPQALNDWLDSEGIERVLSNPVAVAQLKSRINAFYLQPLRDALGELSRQVQKDLRSPSVARLVMSAIVATIGAGVGAVASGTIPDPAVWSQRRSASFTRLGRIKGNKMAIFKTGTFNPKNAIVYFVTHVDTEYLAEAANSADHPMHEEAMKLSDDHAVINQELKAASAVGRLFGVRVSNEGHGTDDNLICKFGVSSLAEIEAVFDKIRQRSIGGADSDTIETGVDFVYAGEFVLYPDGVNNEQVNMNIIDDWLAEQNAAPTTASVKTAEITIPREDVEFTLEVEQDDAPVRGNASASGDEEEDSAIEDEITRRLDNGDVWAWFTARVHATWTDDDDNTFEGVSSWLGGNSYDNAQAFKSGMIWDYLCDDAFDDLQAMVVDSGEYATTASTKRTAKGLGLAEGAINTHIDVLQELLQKGDIRGMKKRVKELETELARVKDAAAKRTATDGSVHACGGTILVGGSGDEKHHYCDSCGAFAYESSGEPVPSGTDKAANQAAWDNGDETSPEATTAAAKTASNWQKLKNEISEAAYRTLSLDNDWKGNIKGYSIWIGCPHNSRDNSFDADVRDAVGRSHQLKSKTLGGIFQQVAKKIVEIDGAAGKSAGQRGAASKTAAKTAGPKCPDCGSHDTSEDSYGDIDCSSCGSYNLGPESTNPDAKPKAPKAKPQKFRQRDLEASKRTASAWKELSDKLGKRWVKNGRGSVIDALHIQEVKGPGIPLFQLKITTPDGSMFKYRPLKTLQEAKSVGDKWEQSDVEGASMVFDQGWTKIAAAKTAEVREAWDLVLYIDSTSALYNQKKSICLNLLRKVQKGTYDAAPILWGYLADAGAKMYAKELPDEDGMRWNQMFPPEVRRAAAAEMAETALVEIKNGEWDFLLKKSAKTATPDQIPCSTCGGSARRAVKLQNPNTPVYFCDTCEDYVKSEKLPKAGSTCTRKAISSAGVVDDSGKSARTRRADTGLVQDLKAADVTPDQVQSVIDHVMDETFSQLKAGGLSAQVDFLVAAAGGSDEARRLLMPLLSQTVAGVRGAKDAGIKIAVIDEAGLSSDDIITVNGYHYVLEPGADPDDNDAWEIAQGRVEGYYRGDVWIDGTRCVLFTDEDRSFAVLPHNGNTIKGKRDASALDPKAARTESRSALLAQIKELEGLLK